MGSVTNMVFYTMFPNDDYIVFLFVCLFNHLFVSLPCN